MGDEYDYAESAYWGRDHDDYSTFLFDDYYEPHGGFHRPPRQKDKKMKTVQDLQAERDEALARADELAKVIEQREKLGADPFKNGSVLKVEMRYPPSRTTYTYAVIKIAGKFWLSGKMQQNTATNIGSEIEGKRVGWTWENFIAWLAQGDASVWQAQNLEQIF
jgi:hypothetical protein